MTDAFDPLLANLSRISDDDIFVSFVKQNTFVQVNEEGTEATAVTTIGIEFTSFTEFVVNRPFVFAIRERTSNTLLFIGKVMLPEDED
jgi:serpin B